MVSPIGILQEFQHACLKMSVITQKSITNIYQCIGLILQGCKWLPKTRWAIAHLQVTLLDFIQKRRHN